MLFVLQRDDARRIEAALSISPVSAAALEWARDSGVRILGARVPREAGGGGAGGAGAGGCPGEGEATPSRPASALIWEGKPCGRGRPTPTASVSGPPEGG